MLRRRYHVRQFCSTRSPVTPSTTRCDDRGHLWIFSTPHGTSRPSGIHRSVKPYDIGEFELVSATHLDGDRQELITNFSYMPAWHKPDRGFVAFFTRYGCAAQRTSCLLAALMERSEAFGDDRYYHVSGIGRAKVGAMFNYHPNPKDVQLVNERVLCQIR